MGQIKRGHAFQLIILEMLLGFLRLFGRKQGLLILNMTT